MKCPYCGVHYMDGERECPVCGKHAGPIAPKKQSKFTNPGFDMPYEAEKEKKATHTAKKSDSAAAWQKAAAQSGSNPHARPGQKKQTTGCSIGCLIALIIMGVIIILTVFSARVGYNAVTTSSREEEPGFLEDDIYESCEIADVLTGTWGTSDGRLSITVHPDGTVAWTDGINTGEDEYPFCNRLLLNETNAGEYCSDEELKRFAIDQYTYYELHATDWENELDEINLHLYLPADQDIDSLTSFECCDCDTEEFYTFIRADAEAPAQPVSQAA